jgi:hypothetical protein
MGFKAAKKAGELAALHHRKGEAVRLTANDAGGLIDEEAGAFDDVAACEHLADAQGAFDQLADTSGLQH